MKDKRKHNWQKEQSHHAGTGRVTSKEEAWQSAGGVDEIKLLGSISKEEADHYRNI